MTNNELTLDQLTAIAGGVKQRDDGRGCTEPNFLNGSKHPGAGLLATAKSLIPPVTPFSVVQAQVVTTSEPKASNEQHLPLPQAGFFIAY